MGNFKQAGVNNLIELRIGDAMKTLANHNESIDLLDLMNKNFVCSLNALFCLPYVTSSPS